MLYALPSPRDWMRGLGVEIKDRKAWLSEGLDTGGRVSAGLLFTHI